MALRARQRRRLLPQDEEQLIDLRPVMELSPVAVLHTTPLPRLHHLFRSLGLARLWIIDTRNQPVGVVTRHDLLPEALRRRVPKHREAPACARGERRTAAHAPLSSWLCD